MLRRWRVALLLLPLPAGPGRRGGGQRRGCVQAGADHHHERGRGKPAGLRDGGRTLADAVEVACRAL